MLILNPSKGKPTPLALIRRFKSVANEVDSPAKNEHTPSRKLMECLLDVEARVPEGSIRTLSKLGIDF